jgi:cell wall-associated NlpC family hydrolase
LATAVRGAVIAPQPKPARVRMIALVALSLALVMAFAETSVVAAGNTPQPAKGSQAALIIKMLRNAVGHPFRIGTEGPKFYDCSGLVWSVYKRAGLVARIGGVRRTVTGYYNWAKRHGGVMDRHNPQVGDVILWGMKGKLHHSGIYIGNGRAISAVNRKFGVRDWPVRWIHMRIFGYIHTRITR